MHKKPSRDKKSGARNPHARPAGINNIQQINDLLSKKPGLARLAAAIPAQQSWLEWLRGAVAPELAPHILQVVPKGGTAAIPQRELVIFADSAAWGTRLRYALSALETQLRARDAAVERWRIRIAPRGS